MSATQHKPEPTRSNEPERPSLFLRTSAAARAIEIGIVITDSEANFSASGRCTRCFATLNARNSNAEYPNVFCSVDCEQEFVHEALASLTIEDCVRIQGRLEALLHSNVDKK